MVFRVSAICLGNICRSPIAEVVLRSALNAAGASDLITVESHGTGDWHVGQDADPRSRAILSNNGYPFDRHEARRISPAALASLDLVLAMDSSNYRTLIRSLNGLSNPPEVRMLRSFDPLLAHVPEPHSDLDVPDPYYGGDGGFADVLQMIENSAQGVVTYVRTRIGE